VSSHSVVVVIVTIEVVAMDADIEWQLVGEVTMVVSPDSFASVWVHIWGVVVIVVWEWLHDLVSLVVRVRVDDWLLMHWVVLNLVDDIVQDWSVVDWGVMHNTVVHWSVVNWHMVHSWLDWLVLSLLVDPVALWQLGLALNPCLFEVALWVNLVVNSVLLPLDWLDIVRVVVAVVELWVGLVVDSVVQVVVLLALWMDHHWASVVHWLANGLLMDWHGVMEHISVVDGRLVVLHWHVLNLSVVDWLVDWDLNLVDHIVGVVIVVIVVSVVAEVAVVGISVSDVSVVSVLIALPEVIVVAVDGVMRIVVVSVDFVSVA